MKKIVNTKNAPAAIGPYSQGVSVEGGRTVFLSGQIALDPGTAQIVEGGVEAETKQVMKNIDALLKEVGATFENVVKTTIFLKDFNDFAAVNQLYGAHFPKNPPARSTVEVARLPRDAKIEIECIVSI
ncbi:MAG: RidA family protein [Proteobacteria bacterium]|nr:MAG: RidA family protein [Pseudomonadota bacterium]